MTTFLTKILAHSRSLGARWSHDQAIEAARMAILAEVPAIEAALPAPVSTMPTQPGEHWEAGTIRRNNTEHARTAPVRALRDAASEVERQCPGHYTSAETLAAAGLPADVVARVVAAVAAAPTYATLPAWVDAPEVLAASLAAMVPDDHDPRGAGPIRPAPGWALHHLSRWPAAAGYTIQATYQGVPVARWSPDGDGLRIMAWDEEQARGRAGKAERKAEHDAYQARLALVRGALDADPALRAAVEAVWAWGHGATVHLYGPAVEAAGHSQGFPAVPVEEPGRSGALALAYLGWGWAPGQAGGVLLVPGVGQVGVRGALRLPQEAGMISSDAAD